MPRTQERTGIGQVFTALERALLDKLSGSGRKPTGAAAHKKRGGGPRRRRKTNGKRAE